MFMKRYEKMLVVVADFLIQMSNSFFKFGNSNVRYWMNQWFDAWFIHMSCTGSLWFYQQCYAFDKVKWDHLNWSCNLV
jgi:hypothetical protein